MQLSERHANMLEARGVDIETAINLGVRSCGRLGPDTIAIPYVRGGRVVNHKYRTLGAQKRFCMDDGGQLCLWNGDVITDQSLGGHPLIICEGELDALVAMSAGWSRVVSVPNGAPSKPRGGYDDGQQYAWLDLHRDALKALEVVIIAADGDDAGANLLHDLSIRLGKPRCKWIRYAAGKDLTDVWYKGGPEAVTRTLNDAKWVHLDGIYSLSDLPPKPRPVPYDTGFDGLSRHYRIRLHDFGVVTGIPGHGKTTFLNDLACRVAKQHGWHVAVASFEQDPLNDFRRNIRTWFNGKPEDRQSAAECDKADAWINQHFSLIVPSDDDEVTPAWMQERIIAAIVRNGAKLVIVDPWNEMDHLPGVDVTMTQYVGEAIRAFKRLARKYLVHVLVAAHPYKMRSDKDGKLPMPTLYDISDSAHWANKPDVGIVIHRDESGDTIIKVAKSRYHDQIGKPGQIRAIFSEQAGRYIVREDRF